jgi:hypothetical protein
VVDLRNIYDPAEMAAYGFHYDSVGRATGGDKPDAGTASHLAEASR